MSNPSGRFDDLLFQKHQWKAVSPWGSYNLQCLDVFTKRPTDGAVGVWISKHLLSCVSLEDSTPLLMPSSVLVGQGSILDAQSMAPGCKWVSANLDHLRAGLRDLKNPRIPQPSLEIFEKQMLSPISLEWNTCGESSLWLMGIAGLKLKHDDTLKCTVGGLEAASVKFAIVREWVDSPDAEGTYQWFPDLVKLAKWSSDWKRDGDVKRLWIATEVLYATEITLKGRKGLFADASAKVPTGAPGLDASAKISVSKSSDREIVVNAARRTRFPVACRIMRVDYSVQECKVVAVRAAGESDLRGDDDDPRQKNLELMKEDIFEVGEGGESVPIPLLTLTE